mmetsp:Transcript_23344/g.43353  ORF Transcript_23344/g.43353 Transcript_23344/m.43353 type:complete len:288 (-) Transcript_23344:287-1150(-)
MLSWFFGESSASTPDLESEQTSSGGIAPLVITGCVQSNHTRNIHDQQGWKQIQKAFDRAKGKPHDIFQKHGHTGIQIEFEVVYDRDVLHNRALVVKEDIKEGTEVWKPWHYGLFSAERPEVYYKFLEQLPHHLQCDALDFSHPSYDGERIEVTMDDGNFIHHAERPEDVNLNIDCEAIRDIKKGERLYMNYTEFVGFHHSIDWFDELKENAFREPKRLGGPSSSPSKVGMWDRQLQQQPVTTLPPEGEQQQDLLSGMILPTLAILFTLFAIKSVRSGNPQSQKNKIC